MFFFVLPKNSTLFSLVVHNQRVAVVGHAVALQRLSALSVRDDSLVAEVVGAVTLRAFGLSALLYRQVLDLYATSVDYDPRTDASKLFFKIVQNKLHYAAHGHTAAEVIYERADAEQPFMGLKTFEGELPAIKDIKIAKNYLHENELKILNNLVSGYFDFAEIMAMEHRPVYMMDYVKQLDTILQSTGRPLLKGSGSISHQEAMEKALAEYRKYQVKTLTPVEQAYLESINALGKIAKRKGKQNDSH